MNTRLNPPNYELELALVRIARALFDFTDSASNHHEISRMDYLSDNFRVLYDEYVNATNRLHPDLSLELLEWISFKHELLSPQHEAQHAAGKTNLDAKFVESYGMISQKIIQDLEETIKKSQLYNVPPNYPLKDNGHEIVGTTSSLEHWQVNRFQAIARISRAIFDYIEYENNPKALQDFQVMTAALILCIKRNEGASDILDPKLGTELQKLISLKHTALDTPLDELLSQEVSNIDLDFVDAYSWVPLTIIQKLEHALQDNNKHLASDAEDSRQ